jgi:ubiquitin carboxyl-terminal hydrolase L5
MQNEVDEAKKKKKSSASRGNRNKKKQGTEAAYHFIAYVPSGNTVYLLDGLESGPIPIGAPALPSCPTGTLPC